jgi:hypothetical protein
MNRMGLTVATVLALSALAVFVSALGIVTSVLVFKTNVIGLDSAVLAAEIVLPTLLVAAVLLHRRLWAEPSRA